MDIISRKYKFIEEFMKIMSIEKLERFEELLRTENDNKEIVAYTIHCEPLSKKDFVKDIKNADASISAGEYTTVEDLEKEVQNW